MEILLLLPLAFAVAAIASRLLWSFLHPVRARVLPVTAESEYKTSVRKWKLSNSNPAYVCLAADQYLRHNKVLRRSHT
jgi:hypothetical protein